jgi:hypothetical protein
VGQIPTESRRNPISIKTDSTNIYKEVQQDHRTVPQTNVGFHARYPLTLLRTLHFEKM